MKIFVQILMSLFLFFAFPVGVWAIEEPTVRPNNKFGVHILFPEELEQAAKLVNSNGGDWGYVTIPIQSTDRNLEKWQRFMDECRRLHLIPIIRIATYPQGNFWTRPTIFDHLDFANFLNSLAFPTKNRYVIVYNEPNSNLEWGGSVDTAHYAEELSRTIDAFKRVNEDFFIISAGLDSHAPNSGDLYKNSYAFLREMDRAVPGIFARIDGFASHSYPNSNFTASPAQELRGGVVAYREEQAFLKRNFKRLDIPIFITETGWDQSKVSEEGAAQFLRFAFENVWREENIVAITPFLLSGQGSPFSGFSMLRADGSETAMYTTIATVAKIKGTPTILEKQTAVEKPRVPVLVKQFSDLVAEDYTLAVSEPLRAVLRWFFY